APTSSTLVPSTTLFRSVRPAALAIKNEGVIADLEAEALRNRILALFDAGIHELFDAPALQTHDVVVVGAVVQLEYRHSVFEMVRSEEHTSELQSLTNLV